MWPWEKILFSLGIERLISVTALSSQKCSEILRYAQDDKFLKDFKDLGSAKVLERRSGWASVKPMVMPMAPGRRTSERLPE